MTEDEIRNIIIGGGLGTGQFSERQMASAYDKIILELANDLIDSFTAQVEKDTGSSSGELKQSIVPKIKKGGFDIEAEYYYKFIDGGVSGVGQFSGAMSPIRSVVSNGAYSFENLYVPKVMAKSIREWSGASIEQSYAIGVNIKRYGIKPKNITDKVITEEVLERISQDLLTATGLIVSVSFNKTFE